jgi:hypothetical protein
MFVRLAEEELKRAVRSIRGNPPIPPPGGVVESLGGLVQKDLLDRIVIDGPHGILSLKLH